MEWQKLRWPHQPGASEECQPFEREDADDEDDDGDDDDDTQGQEAAEQV